MAFEPKKKGFFGRLSEKIADVVMGRPAIDEELLEELDCICSLAESYKR